MPGAWFDDYAEDDDEIQIDEYDITATPNDFNVSTLFHFIELGAVRIQDFSEISYGIKSEHPNSLNLSS